MVASPRARIAEFERRIRNFERARAVVDHAETSALRKMRMRERLAHRVISRAWNAALRQYCFALFHGSGRSPLVEHRHEPGPIRSPAFGRGETGIVHPFGMSDRA